VWERTFVSRRLTFTELELRAAVEASRCYSDVLRHLGLRTAGGNPRTVQKYVALWGIPVDHFDPDAVRATRIRRPPIPLVQLLVEHSTYDRGHLKDRLYATGLKARSCELCGQGEIWRGARMSLILDHINGVATDNRLDNLRIVCPNCNATLATHCGRANRRPPRTAECAHCGDEFRPKYLAHRYCCRDCGQRQGGASAASRRAAVEARTVERPPYEQLIREIEATSWSAVGRKYGVSDNAVRKWVRWYEAAAA
jgi:hypothetical protein